MLGERRNKSAFQFPHFSAQEGVVEKNAMQAQLTEVVLNVGHELGVGGECWTTAFLHPT